MENDVNVGRENRISTIYYVILVFIIGYGFYRYAESKGYQYGYPIGYRLGSTHGFGNGYEHGVRVAEYEHSLSGNPTGRESSLERSSNLSEYARQVREGQDGSSEREGSARDNQTETGSRSIDYKTDSKRKGSDI